MARKRAFQACLDAVARRLRRSPAPAAAAPPEPCRPKNLLFLGGSNTMMAPGYADATVACLTARYGPLGRVANLAVGANTVIHGLMLAKAAADLSDYDLVIVEYGVNDIRLSAEDAMSTWRAGAEGLIRYLLADRPDRRILFAQFNRRAMKPYHFRPGRELRGLGAHYGRTHGVAALDLDGLFRRTLFRDAAAFAALYADDAHFRRPEISAFVGALVAAEVAAAPAPRAPAPLPDPVHPWHFQHARLIDLAPDRATAPPLFRNSRFALPARRVPVGEDIRLDLPGALIGLEFVSTPAAATLRATEGDAAPVAMHTRHKTAGARYPFLLQSAPMAWKQWDDPRPPRAPPAPPRIAARRAARPVPQPHPADAPGRPARRALPVAGALRRLTARRARRIPACG